MKQVKSVQALCNALGYEFKNKALLTEALTHASASTAARPDNQRLEFLGDRILGMCIAQLLYARYPKEAEGALSARLHALVCRKACADIAKDLRLGECLHMGRSESIHGGRRKEALLADATESLLAAIYLDAGLEITQGIVERLWHKQLSDQKQAVPQNPKTALQEWAQGQGFPPPDYQEIGRSGPPHAPVFVVSVQLADGGSAEASAASKRAAERDAAALMLAQLQSRDL